MESNLTPLEDLKKEALKQYEEGAKAIHHWSSFIVTCIRDYQPIEQPDHLPDVGEMIHSEPPLEIKICTRCNKEFKSEINNPICPSCFL